LTAALAQRFKKRGERVAIFNLSGDAREIADLQRLSPELADCAVSAGAGAADALKRAADGIALIEAADDQRAANKALAERVDASVLLILNYGEDGAELADFYGDRLGGVIVNNVPKYKAWEFERSAAHRYADLNLLGHFLEDRLLLAPDFNHIVGSLKGEYVINQDKADCLIDNYLIGGLVLDWGPDYFGLYPNSCVVARGDRPDLQIAAMQTDAVKALLLTNASKPIDYVYYEARARGIPLATVAADTRATADNLAKIKLPFAFNHPLKLQRMVELLEKQTDITAVDELAMQPATR